MKERKDERRARLAKAAALGLWIGMTTQCDEPAKSAVDANKDGGGASSTEPIDRSGNADKAHCGGKGE